MRLRTVLADAAGTRRPVPPTRSQYPGFTCRLVGAPERLRCFPYFGSKSIAEAFDDHVETPTRCSFFEIPGYLRCPCLVGGSQCGIHAPLVSKVLGGQNRISHPSDSMAILHELSHSWNDVKNSLKEIVVAGVCVSCQRRDQDRPRRQRRPCSEVQIPVPLQDLNCLL